MVQRYAWLVLILLAAASLRLAGLSQIPPGLTHDEADHGLDAWGVVNGDRPIYFTVGYGREPFFDYATAGLMSFMGPSFLAGRLTAVYLSLIMIAGTFTWAQRAFGFKTAIMTAAGLAVSFWAVMTGRQALRSIALPTIFVLAMLFFWWALQRRRDEVSMTSDQTSKFDLLKDSSLLYFSLAGVLIGISIYTYIPARIMWLVIPLVLIFMAAFDRPGFKLSWRGTLLTLALAAIVAAPLIIYLGLNQEVEVRVAELSQPFREAITGDFSALLKNSTQSALIFAFKGDSHWRYNIPGRPFLSPVMAILLFLGLLLAIWQIGVGIRHRERIRKATASFMAIIWLLLALVPVLITGPDLSMTQAIGLQPILYLFPALTLFMIIERIPVPQKVSYGFVVILFLVVAVLTIRDYFFLWAKAPEVRVQYESTLSSAINYLNDQGADNVAISTTTPNQLHSPAVAELMLNNPAVSLGWFDGQHSLLIPKGNASTLIFSGFAALNPDLKRYFQLSPVEEVPLPASDLDRPLTVYTVAGDMLVDKWRGEFSDAIVSPNGVSVPVQFGEAIELLGYDLQTKHANPGEQIRLVTLWRANMPVDGAVLFTHVIGDDGQPLAQDDRLDVPSFAWKNEDVFIQLHQFTLPEAIAPGEYPLHLGIYTRDGLQRIPIILDDKNVADHLSLPPLKIGQ
jgi:hypothetical protein